MGEDRQEAQVPRRGPGEGTDETPARYPGEHGAERVRRDGRADHEARQARVTRSNGSMRGAKVSSVPARLTRSVAKKKIRDARECPKDWCPSSKETRRSHHRTVELDICPTCNGLFLDQKEIRTLTGSSSLNKLLTKYLGLDADSQLICPNCGGLMDGEDAGGVRVDVCLDCYGVWLDAGELERLGAMSDAEFREFTPDKIDEILKAKEIKHEEHRKAIRSLFRGLGRP